MQNSELWLDEGEGAMTAVFAHAVPSLTREPQRFPVWAVPPARRQRSSALHERLSSLERASIEEIRRHARRVATFSAAVGRHIGVSENDVRLLRVGSLLHDVGKAAIPAQVLLKCGRLSAEEFAAVKRHPVIADLLCARVPGLASVRPIVRFHHERLDGSGYPDHRRGDEIPLLAQIVGVVDVYDALVYPRPYKPAFDREHAFSILRREADLGWRSADLVEALVDVVDREGDWLSIVASV